LHKKIQDVASLVIGVDLLEEMVVRLNEKGFNIIKGNVEELSFVNELKNQKFDIIVAGDLIEHLFNPGRFLEGIKPFFHENTELILTTPNCFSTSYMLSYIFSGFEIVREDHTCWYSEKTLKQLLEMNNYEITEFHYSSEKKINGIRPFFRVIFRRFFPRFCEGLIFVVKLRK
jgi:2-polyprenyl-3-methyl-5-hydroxy-6-metoxy-1,4-benzoquinol methylase